jgi:hypothetical protein
MGGMYVDFPEDYPGVNTAKLCSGGRTFLTG